VTLEGRLDYHARVEGYAEARRSRWLLVAVTAVLSTLATLALLEIALRIWRGGLFDPTPPAPQVSLVDDYPAIWDARLGFAPRPNTKGRRNPWGKLVTLDADGLRSNGTQPKPSGPTVLAIGDSFTFGDEVDDGETWPAALERRIGRRVVNGGGFGYGLDQMVLRAETLLSGGDFESLIVSVIPDDVLRCEYAYRFGHKPYFELEAERLVLRNVPVPRPEVSAPGENGLRRVLRRSYLGELVVHRLDPIGWLIRGNVRVHREGTLVARALVDRLADDAERLGLRLLLVAAWHPGARVEPLAPALARAGERSVPVLRLEPVLRREIEARGDWSDLFIVSERGGRRRSGHMTGLGNGIVATAIAERLRALGISD